MGSPAASVQVNAPRGMVVKAACQIKVRAQARVADKDRTRTEERNLNLHEVLEFKEEIELDPARIRFAIDEASRKAADRLRKHQKAGGGGLRTRVPARAGGHHGPGRPRPPVPRRRAPRESEAPASLSPRAPPRAPPPVQENLTSRAPRL